MKKHFTHLHLHTEFSLLDGAIRIPDLMKFAQQQEWKAIGMTDHGNVFGAVKFFDEAKKHKIKPVLGCEMYFTPDIAIKKADEKYNHLILLVQNREGYQNLCRLIAHSYQEGFYFKPRIDYAALEKYNKGLIVSTACLGGHIPSLLRHGEQETAEKWISWGLDVFGRDRFFLELMPSEITLAEFAHSEQAKKQEITNQRLIAAGKKLGADCIVTADAHFLHESDHEAH
jgi:DNA polymerase-3 subunit alpha